MLARLQLLAGFGFVATLLPLTSQARWTVSWPPLTYYGMCDASGGVAIGTNLFAVADDEGNKLRIYRSDMGGLPLAAMDMTSFLHLDPKHPETDLEGAAWLGDWIFWIGSHGRNREGKKRPNRCCFFATKVRTSPSGVHLVPVGSTYNKLLKDLTDDARLKPFKLARASRRAPKSKGALNIEGLCAFRGNALLLGFRNPIPQDRALLVPLLNPNEVIFGRRAKLGPPIRLDLGGLGVRDLAEWQGKILILAGPYHTEKEFRLFVWDGHAESPEPVKGIDFHNLSPEALVVYPPTSTLQVLSDDGTLRIQGLECKRLSNPDEQRFQSVWVTPSP